MSQNKPLAQSAAQAGPSGEATGVGPAVGGVRSSEDLNWLDLWAMNPETRAYLASARRDAACSHASSRREGAGDGPQGIRTPEKLRHLQDTLYRKAKAESVREQAECWRMKRPGKPDTGNPFVRFDEERSGSAELTTTVGPTRLLPLRLRYQIEVFALKALLRGKSRGVSRRQRYCQRAVWHHHPPAFHAQLSGSRSRRSAFKSSEMASSETVPSPPASECPGHPVETPNCATFSPPYPHAS